MRRPLRVELRLARQRWRDARTLIDFTGDRRPSAWWWVIRRTIRRER